MFKILESHVNDTADGHRLNLNVTPVSPTPAPLIKKSFKQRDIFLLEGKSADGVTSRKMLAWAVKFFHKKLHLNALAQRGDMLKVLLGLDQVTARKCYCPTPFINDYNAANELSKLNPKHLESIMLVPSPPRHCELPSAPEVQDLKVAYKMNEFQATAIRNALTCLGFQLIHG